MCIKGLVLAFVSRLSLWYWSWHFDHTLQVFIIVLGWSTVGIYGFQELKLQLEHANKTGHYPHWDEVKFTDRDPHWYSRRVKEAIHILRLRPNNINRDSGIEIPEAWMFTIRQHDNRPLPQRTTKESVSSSHKANNALDRNPPTTSKVCDTPITNNHGGINSLTQ